jgi:hypothetical protein
MVHDVDPPAETLLSVILEPPFLAGKEIFTTRFTFPFFGFEEVTETIVGAEGFVTLVFEETACVGDAKAESTSPIADTSSRIFFMKTSFVAFMVQHTNQFFYELKFGGTAY